MNFISGQAPAAGGRGNAAGRGGAQAAAGRGGGGRGPAFVPSPATAAAAAAQNKPAPAGTMSWFSGATLARGVFYDPVSLAFQPKVARVEASEHVNVTYEWKSNQLQSVHTKYNKESS